MMSFVSQFKVIHCVYLSYFFSLLNTSFFLFLRFIYLFIFRGAGKEKERENHHRCVVASHVSLTGDLACNPGMHPDWESNQQPLGLQAHTQSTPLSYTSQDLEQFFNLSLPCMTMTLWYLAGHGFYLSHD